MRVCQFRHFGFKSGGRHATANSLFYKPPPTRSNFPRDRIQSFPKLPSAPLSVQLRDAQGGGGAYIGVCPWWGHVGPARVHGGVHMVGGGWEGARGTFSGGRLRTVITSFAFA